MVAREKLSFVFGNSVREPRAPDGLGARFLETIGSQSLHSRYYDLAWPDVLSVSYMETEHALILYRRA